MIVHLTNIVGTPPPLINFNVTNKRLAPSGSVGDATGFGPASHTIHGLDQSAFKEPGRYDRGPYKRLLGRTDTEDLPKSHKDAGAPPPPFLPI